MKKRMNKKIFILIAIILIAVILTIVITNNINQKAKIDKEVYLATTANGNSELVASCIKEGVTIGGITGTLEALDTSDATATADDILNGKTAYARGEKITGTFEKSANIIDLGVGRTFNLTSYSNYKEFTINNFFCEPINNSLPTSPGDIQGPRRFASGINFAKSYNQETGTLTATAYSVIYYMNSGNQFEGTYGTYAYNVHAYLVY